MNTCTNEFTRHLPICMHIESERAQACAAGINAHIVHDAGRTQVAAGSATVLAIGPGASQVFCLSICSLTQLRFRCVLFSGLHVFMLVPSSYHVLMFHVLVSLIGFETRSS
jgi:hypothetical protein